MSTPQALRCATHPEVETYLRCNECGTAICPRCLVQTPVGAKCRRCARLRPHPLYEVSMAQRLRAAGAALAAGLGLGLLWGVVQGALPFFGFLSWIVYAGLGYLVGEATSAGSGRKHGRSLQVLAVLGTVLAFAVSLYLRFGPGFWLIFVPGIGTTFTTIIHWVLLVVASLIASSRVR